MIPAMPCGGAISAARRGEDGPLLRIHAGLEAPEDLIADLDDGLARYNRAR
ncbi:MAG: hypothetical protein ACR2P7_08590 [bacterium]